ncbi:unnamed protein product [Discula destructiva]
MEGEIPVTTTYLIRLSQSHEAFRLVELQSLAEIENVPFTTVSYSPESPILLIKGPPDSLAATRLVRRATLTQAIYEHWGSGTTLDALHASVRADSAQLWPAHATAPWKFSIDAFQGGRARDRDPAQRTALINTFRYLPLTGPISLKHPKLELCIFELYQPHAASPHMYHFGRLLGPGARDLPARYDLKTRPYISTTSMAADLALLTANIALAAPGKLFYDPFVGTGSFPLACAAFGAVVWGSDIDGRAVRGAGADARAKHQQGKVKGEKTLKGNFVHYGLQGRLGDVFASDLTHSPLRRVGFGRAGPVGRGRRLFDGVVCDPPYGVREGLRVLGCRDPEGTPWVVEAGHTRYKDPAFIPPKKPYSFDAMLCDILHFASETLVDDGRLAFWMPTANPSTSSNDASSNSAPSPTTTSASNNGSSSSSPTAGPPSSTDPSSALPIPTHPALALVSVCTQPFNRWSRRLLTYRKLPDAHVDPAAVQAWLDAQRAALEGVDGVVTADELNPFRKGYFSGFGTETTAAPVG